MSYYNQNSNYFIGQGQMAPPWSCLPYQQYQQDWPGTCNNLPRPTPVQEGATNSPITISPSNSADEESDSTEPTVVSASVRVICPHEKRADHKTFMLRDVNVEEMKSTSAFRKQLYSQFGDEFIDRGCEFDFGFYRGTKRIWVRNDHDLKDLVELLQTKSTTLWCEGLSKKRKKSSDSPGSDEESGKARTKKKKLSDETNSRVDDIIDELRELHGHAYTNLQYRVWAETIVGGRHVSLENPPRGSYFKRSKVLQSHDHSPEKIENKKPTVITPVRAAELKTIYISQIKDLYSLFEAGAISGDDFQKQKSSILELMDKL